MKRTSFVWSSAILISCLLVIGRSDAAPHGDYINVRDHGAVGDGLTDDSAAIQTAIDLAWETGRWCFLPAGVYCLDEPLIVKSGARLSGVRGYSVLACRDDGEAAIDVSASTRNVSKVIIEGVTFDPLGQGCYGIKGAVSASYLAVWQIRDCSFSASLGHGLYGLWANLLVENCEFGRTGTPGVVWQPVYVAGNVSKVTFTNAFRHCWFERATGCLGAVEFGTGNTTVFTDCIFELLKTPAVRSKGMQNLLFVDANFEHIDPIDANDVIVDLSMDSTGAYVLADFVHCRFKQPTALTDALVFANPGCSTGFRSCWGVNPNGYFTVSPTGVYDTGVVDIVNCRMLADASALNESYSIRRTVHWQTNGAPWSVPARSAPPSTGSDFIYLDDGTNTGTGTPGLRRFDGDRWQDLAPNVFGKGQVVGNGPSSAGYTVYKEDADNGANHVELTARADLQRNHTVVLPLTAVHVFDPNALVPGTSETCAIPVTGAAPGDVCVVGFDQIREPLWVIQANVISDGVVSVTLVNHSDVTRDLDRGKLRVHVWQ